ncbi:hypothetical protein MHU86_4874 [Fragilaria crotonensis]|nr:hypothetical protein MHU86_4874 [Fragilaria crotonensis]
MAAPAPHFALAPAFANPDVLNYSEQAAAKLFKSGTEALSIKFDCKSDNLQLFLDQTRDRSIVFDWLNILSIPIQGNVANSKDLIESYGEISYEEVRAHALTYMHEDAREAQDSFMMYHCLMNSLTDAAQKQVRTRGNVHPFIFGGKGSGPVLLKVIIMVSHVDTRATITSVRTKLSSLDHAMRDIDSDIELFNDYVLGLVSKLSARGEQTQDLLVNLFKGYKACKDAEFVDYIKKKEDFYEEGGQVEYQQLMDWALNKFKTRKESEQWCLKTTEEETIIALQSQVKTLMSNQKKPNPASGKSSGGGKKDNKQGNKKDKGKGKFRVEDLPAWVHVHPKEGEKQSKTVEGKDYHWCPNHNRWTRHKPSDCKGIGFKGGPKKDQGNKGQDSKQPSMKLAKALQPSPMMMNDGDAQWTACSLGFGFSSGGRDGAQTCATSSAMAWRPLSNLFRCGLPIQIQARPQER